MPEMISFANHRKMREAYIAVGFQLNGAAYCINSSRNLINQLRHKYICRAGETFPGADAEMRHSIQRHIDMKVFMVLSRSFALRSWNIAASRSIPTTHILHMLITMAFLQLRFIQLVLNRLTCFFSCFRTPVSPRPVAVSTPSTWTRSLGRGSGRARERRWQGAAGTLRFTTSSSVGSPNIGHSANESSVGKKQSLLNSRGR